MNETHWVRPPWLGLVLAVLGAALLGVGNHEGQLLLSVVGAGLLVGGAGLAVSDHGRGGADHHESRSPARMVDDPVVKRRGRELDRRRVALERAAHDAPRGPLAPLGAIVLVLVALFLVVAQWEVYPLGRTSQDNALRSLAVAVVAGLAGLRILVAQPARHRLASLLALLAGVGLLVSAFLFPHEIRATRIDEVISGGLVVLAAAVALVSPLRPGMTSD